MAIEEEENQRELNERIRRKELREEDEFTENQIKWVQKSQSNKNRLIYVSQENSRY